MKSLPIASNITILNTPEDGTSPEGKVRVRTPNWPGANDVADTPLTVSVEPVAAYAVVERSSQWHRDVGSRSIVPGPYEKRYNVTVLALGDTV